MTIKDVQEWLDRYVAAWRSGDRDDIAALFSGEASYRYRPYGSDLHTFTGRDVIVESWLEDPDAEGSWEASYRPWIVDEARAVAIGTTHYRAADDAPDRRYRNVFLLVFAPDGRCAELTEYYVLEERERVEMNSNHD
jgi:hypothetical protein